MRPLRVFVGCEKSGVMRRAFAKRGHDAWSCDLLPADDGSNHHIRGDVRDHLSAGWDLAVILHPPCFRLCLSGIWCLTKPPKRLELGNYSAAEVATYALMDHDQRLAFMWRKLEEGAALFSDCWNAPAERVAVENPRMHRHAKARIRNYADPTQIVQPHEFGDPFFKATGWYLRNLPPLEPTDKLAPPAPGTREHAAWSKIHRMSPGPGRSRQRSETFPGMAEACADKWGGWALEQRLAA